MKLMLGLLGGIFIVIGSVWTVKANQSEPNGEINIQQLAWEIRKSTGINCGGYFESQSVPQKCSLTLESGGLKIFLDSDIESKRQEINVIIAKHVAQDSLPMDYPIKPIQSPTATLKERFEDAQTDSERIEILAEKAGLK